jgi:enamine deaminase RidA (YjgF/YER057c/UK114 family)
MPSIGRPAGCTGDYCTPLRWIMHGGTNGRRPPRPSGQNAAVTITRSNPDGLHTTPGYHHVTVVPAGRMAYLAGQCPLDAQGALVGASDLDAQVDQVAANALAALRSVGAGPEHVVRTVIYVVSTDRDALAAVWRRLQRSPLSPAFTTASTLLGVAQLGFPGQLVELDVTAALP